MNKLYSYWNYKIDISVLIGQSNACCVIKANFGVLEGFLTVLIGDDIHIVEILESEGNQQTEEDKFNRVDIKALNSKK